MLSTFVVNKIDDHWHTALAYGDIITFQQIFDQSSGEKHTKKKLKN